MSADFRKFLKGFRYAAEGIVYAVKTQINFRFHLTAAVWVMLLSLFYDFSSVQYAVLFLTIGAVISAEMVNTAVEKAVDLYTKDENKTAKAAKDTAAGAVLIAALIAVCIGVCLFGDISVIKEIIEFLIQNPAAAVFAVFFAAGSVIFIFKGI